MSNEKSAGTNRKSTDGPSDGKAAYEQCGLRGSIEICGRPSQPAKSEAAKACWICGGAVSLESCKTDENGHPVHEECYVARVKLGMLK